MSWETLNSQVALASLSILALVREVWNAGVVGWSLMNFHLRPKLFFKFRQNQTYTKWFHDKRRSITVFGITSNLFIYAIKIPPRFKLIYLQHTLSE